jgi:Na+-driven multidrug efflux pump
LLSRLWAKGSRLKPALPWQTRPRPSLRVIRRIYAIGLPGTVGHLSMAVAGAIINVLLFRIIHRPVAVGALAITMRLEMFGFVLVFAMLSAVVPMVGYNLGARQLDRCKQTIQAACAIAAAVMGWVGVVLVAAPHVFIGLFSQDPEVLSIGTQYLSVNCWTYAMIGCSIMLSAGFQGLGRTHYAMYSHLLRALIVRVPAAWVLASVWGLGGLWWSFPMSLIASLMLSVSLMRRLFRRLEQLTPAAGVTPEELRAIALASDGPGEADGPAI